MSTENRTTSMIDTVEISNRLGITRTAALHLLKSGAFGPYLDVAAPGTGRQQPRITSEQFDAFMASRTRTPNTPSAEVEGQMELTP